MRYIIYSLSKIYGWYLFEWQHLEIYSYVICQSQTSDNKDKFHIPLEHLEFITHLLRRQILKQNSYPI